MFDAIAPRYDLLNRVLSARVDVAWRLQAVRALAVREGDCILDLATGTGDLLLEELTAGATRSVGADLSFGMLRLARPKFDRGGHPGARVCQSDAERLPFADARFDGASIAFGIRNVLDRAQGLREMRRVVKPGRRVVVLEFHETRGVIGVVFRFYFNHILPQIGALVSSRAAYSYLPRSVANFESPEGFGALMRAAGLRDVRSRPLTFGIAWLHVGEV
ncbi:MAG: ubiquinone/menaquinone biosynthesis methyltransferase [Vicinamibacteria bacterium]|nr:ubiquinone/menaquinone biosynthesis methyltransferase [Vicinamibacteria bacterium]